MQGFTLPGDTPEPLFARFHLAEFLTFFGAKKEAKKHPPPPRPPPIWGGCNRSSCRSYILVSSTHQRVGMFLSTTLDAGRLTLVDDVSVGSDHPLGSAAYMSEASLKKGPAWVFIGCA